MAKVLDCCVWCHKLCTHPKGFDPKKSILVCSPGCGQKEKAFRIHFSDVNIGLRNMAEHGVNPNDRGKRK